VFEQRVAQTQARIFGQRRWFGIAENLNGLFRGIDYDAAVIAIIKMLFDGRF
jgi:hypothetical protein